MLHITEEQVREHLPMAKAVELMREAFGQLADGTAVNHPRQRVILKTGSLLHYMAAGNNRYFGIKSYSSNPKTGAHFTVLLYRSEDGMPLASIEANAVGQIRTGAASGLATDLLARKDASVIGIIGSGYQAETQLHAMAAVRRIHEVRVWSRNREKCEQFASKFDLPIRIAASANDAAQNADIVVTATNSKDPVLDNSAIAPGTHINAMGSNWATRRELPSDLVNRADLVAVDAIDAARIEAGDLLLGKLPEERWIDLAAVVAGRHSGRADNREITIFKSVGLAIEDVVAAGHVYEQVTA